MGANLIRYSKESGAKMKLHSKSRLIQDRWNAEAKDNG